MSFPTGHPKFGGRRKNTPNKRTSELRRNLIRVLGHCEERIEDDIKELSAAESTKLWLAMQQFILPKVLPKQPKSDKDQLPPPIIISKEVVHREMNDEERKFYLGE